MHAMFQGTVLASVTLHAEVQQVSMYKHAFTLPQIALMRVLMCRCS